MTLKLKPILISQTFVRVPGEEICRQINAAIPALLLEDIVSIVHERDPDTGKLLVTVYYLS